MSDRPIAGIAVCWVLGYMLAYSYPLQWFNLYLTIGAGVLGCIVILSTAPGKSVLAGMLIIAAAAGIYGEHDRNNKSSLSFAGDAEAEVTLLGRIATPVTVDGDRVSFQAEAESITYNGTIEAPAKERFIISVRLLHKTEQETASQWQRGDKLELTGTIKQPGEARNFGGFDYRRYLHYQHVHWQITAKGVSTVMVTTPGKGEWGTWLPLRWNDRIRGMLAAKVEMLFPPPQSGFMQGMLIGLTDGIDPQQFDRFSRLGLTHIIAISGLNVAIFLACVLWLLRRLGLTRETYLLTAIALIPFYIAFTGASPSVVRAGIMAMIALYAAYRGTMKDGMHIALVAGLGMLMLNPYYLVDVSFQLSYLVTLGIMIGVPHMSKLLSIRPRGLKDALSITIVAQLVSFPVSIYYFNQFSLLSLLANLILVPVFSLFVMPVGTVAMITALLSDTLGQWIAWTVVQMNKLLFSGVEWLSSMDFFQTLWPSPKPAWIVLFYGALALLGWSLHARRESEADRTGHTTRPMLYTDMEAVLQKRFAWLNRTVILPVSISGFIALLWFGYNAQNGGSEGKVQFLDVGQGDSILIRSPGNGHTILVDGGGTLTFRKPGDEWKERTDPYEVGKKLLVPLLKKRGVQAIDEMILTHQDADHYGGLQAVLEQIPVRRLLFNGTLNPNQAVQKLFRTALEKGTELVEANAGDTLMAGEQTMLYFLYPLPDADERDIRLEKDQNPSSVVFLMEMAGTRWMFTGDMDQASERRLLAQWSVVQQETARTSGRNPSGDGGNTGMFASATAAIAPVDVLKIAHHGSKTSTSEEWLAAWKPKHAVISVGLNNLYRHPNEQVLDRLHAHDISVHRTDRHGEVQMSVKDGQIRMRTKL